MKNVLKLGAVVLAIVMVLSMSVTAFASDPATLNSGVAGSATGSSATALAKSVTIPKALKVFNPDSLTVNGPTMSYSYAISAGSPNKSVTDSQTTPVTAMTKAGLEPEKVTLTGTSANTIDWTNADQLSASSTGTDSTKNLIVNFSAVTFTGAGIYRYIITETATADAYTASGVTDGTSSASGDNRTESLYLDVYVRDPGDGETGYQIYGYVLASADTDQPASTSNKVSAFTTDEYHTSNVTVSKTLEGDGAMNSHPFPFHVAFSNSSVTANVQLKKSVNNAEATNMTAGTLSSTNAYETIAHNQNVKYIGIPAGTTVSAYETNNVTGTTYSSAATVTASGTNAGAKNISWTTAQGSYTAYVEQAYNSNLASVTTTNDSANFTEPFVNTLMLVSPTGVALRVAPYALMLGVGLFLVLFMRRRKNQAEA